MLAWISRVSARERGYIEHYSVAVVCYYGVMMTSFTEVRYHYNICRPVARTFRRGDTFVSDASVCMHKHARLWHALLGKFQKWDALRLLLRPFWDRSKAVVATWLAAYCIQFLAVHVYIC